MITASHEFKLLGELESMVTVSYAVTLDMRGDIEMIAPEYVTMSIGGNCGNEEPFRKVVGPLKAWIISKSERFGFDDLGITQDEINEEMDECCESERFEREHAAGAI